MVLTEWEFKNDSDGCIDVAVVRSGISSNISKYWSMHTLMSMPSVIEGGVDDERGGEANEVVVSEISGIEQNWVSRMMLVPATRLGEKHRARLVASMRLIDERMDMS